MGNSSDGVGVREYYLAMLVHLSWFDSDALTRALPKGGKTITWIGVM